MKRQFDPVKKGSFISFPEHMTLCRFENDKRLVEIMAEHHVLTSAEQWQSLLRDGEVSSDFKLRKKKLRIVHELFY